MIKKLFHSVMIGLVCAAVILVFSHVNQFSLLKAPEPMSFKDAVRVASPAVVNVYNRSFSANSAEQLEVGNLGSGVIMSKDGYILTNKHVIQNADQIVVALQNGQLFDASLIGSDTLTDLAVLKIRADNLSTIPQNPQRQMHVGDVALAIGNPYNLGKAFRKELLVQLDVMRWGFCWATKLYSNGCFD